MAPQPHVSHGAQLPRPRPGPASDFSPPVPTAESDVTLDQEPETEQPIPLLQVRIRLLEAARDLLADGAAEDSDSEGEDVYHRIAECLAEARADENNSIETNKT
jgi:hypothetical protein